MEIVVFSETPILTRCMTQVTENKLATSPYETIVAM